MKWELALISVLAAYMIGCSSINPDSGNNSSSGSASSSSSGSSSSTSSSGTSSTGNFGLYTETYPANVVWDNDTKLDIWTDWSAGANVSDDTGTFGDGTKSWKFVGTGAWIGIGVRVNPLTNCRNLSAYSNGNLNFMYKGTKTFKVGIKDGNNTEKWVSMVPGTYGFSTSDAWCSVKIPLSEFSGIDFSKIQQYFMFVADSGFSYAVGDVHHIDKVYFDKGISYTESHWKDDFTNFNTGLWKTVNNFTWDNNGSYMQSANVEFSGGTVGISMIKSDPVLNPPVSGRTNSCGQLNTVAFSDPNGYDFKYGKYIVRMKAATGSGVVSSFYLFRYSPWQEIDIEFLGADTTKIHLNIYYNSGTGNNANDNPTIHSLGFDAANAYHDYAIEWESDHISWYVDNTLIETRNSPANNIPYAAMYLSMNVWNCNSTNWAGDLFTDSPNKRTATYESVEYYPSGTY